MNCGADRQKKGLVGMKHIGSLLGMIAVLAGSAGAQGIQQEDRSSLTWSASASPTDALSPITFPSRTLVPGGAPSYPVTPASASAEPAALPQAPEGVFANYDGRAYIGYTFDRFYVLPQATSNQSTIVNSNGFDGSLAYYYHGGWFGAEGELVAAFGSFAGQSSSLVMGGGGARIRWSLPSGTELWAHSLVGGAHFSPQTAYGPESALAYEVGGGIDISTHRRRIAYRIEGDMVGTRFFGTEQYSPKISAGVVFKF